MQIGELLIASEVIDGQTFYLTNFQQWQVLLKTNPLINGKYLINLSGRDPKSMLETTKTLVEFTGRHPIFSIAFYEILSQRPWYLCALLKNNGSWQRVDIGGRTCEKCGWSGSTADPTNITLYAGSPMRTEAIDKAWNIPTIGCPRCNNKLPGHIIWVENESD